MTRHVPEIAAERGSEERIAILLLLYQQLPRQLL